MSLIIPADFTPDSDVKIIKSDIGQVFWAKVVDKTGLAVDLTNATKIELTFKNTTNINASQVVVQCIKSDALNGFIYLVSNANWSDIGICDIFVTVSWATSADFPNGREITSYNCFPSTIEIIEK